MKKEPPKQGSASPRTQELTHVSDCVWGLARNKEIRSFFYFSSQKRKFEAYSRLTK